MNERIRQLAKEAGITTNIDTDYFERDMNKWVDYFSEKFAQLIVRECRDVVSNTRDQAIDDGWNVDEAMSTAMFNIEEHFGVEE